MKKWIFGFILLLSVSEAKSQASLGFTSHATPGLADTVIMGSNITYGVTVSNTGTQPLNTNYTVYLALLDTAAFIPVVIDSVNVTNNSLMPGDSAQITITQNVNSSKFVDGNNTVVIWPAAPGYQTTDTIWKDIFVIYFSNVDELSDNQIFIYPSPATDYIYINTEKALEEVRIWNVNGKLISSFNSRVMDISGLNSGLYIIEVKTTEGKYLRRKLMVN